MLLQRATTVATTPDALRSVPGPALPRYVWVLSLRALFRWVVGSAAEDDGFTVLVPTTGGFQGAWLLCRPSPTPSGAPVLLGDADAQVSVGQGFWFQLPAATLTAPHTVTLETTNAALGDEVELSRFDTTANALTWANGGPAGGTIVVLSGGTQSFAVAYFDGSNFVLRRSARML